MTDGKPRIVVRLPPALLALFPDTMARVEIPAETVAGMVHALNERWPGMRDRLCDSTPAIRRHINVFVAGERATLNTPLEPGTEVTILTAIRGG